MKTILVYSSTKNFKFCWSCFIPPVIINDKSDQNSLADQISIACWFIDFYSHFWTTDFNTPNELHWHVEIAILLTLWQKIYIYHSPLFISEAHSLLQQSCLFDFIIQFITLQRFYTILIIQILTETVMKYHVSVDCQESYIFPRENIVPRENITILAPPTRDISSVPVDICYIRW